MDYVTRQFVNLAKKFRKELPKLTQLLNRNIQEQTEAIREARDAYEESRNTPPILRAELQIPHAIEIKTDPKDKKTGRELYTLIVHTFTLLAVIVYAVVTIRMWREMISTRHQTAIMFDENKRQFKDTLDQMEGQTIAQQDAANVARSTLEVSQRAYLIIEIADIDYKERNVLLLLTNIGHIPPSNVITIVHESTVSRPIGEVNKPPFPPRPIEEMHWTKDEVYGEMSVSRIYIHVRLPKVDEPRMKNNQQKISIVGTVTYNDGFPKTKDQITPFCFATGIHSGAVIWGTCTDWKKELAFSEKADKYPSEEYRTIN